jgi:integrase
LNWIIIGLSRDFDSEGNHSPMLKIEDIEVSQVNVPAHRSMVVYTSRTLRGLQFKAKRNGRREWHLRYTRLDGARTSLKLGDYPDIDYSEALESGREKKEILRHGIDPVESSRFKKIKQRQQAITSGLVVDTPYRLSNVTLDYIQYIEQVLKPGTVKKYRSLINVHILPAFGGWDIRVIDLPEYEATISNIAKKSKSAGGNAHRVMRAMLSYAVDKNLIQANTLLGRRSIVKRTTVEPKKRVLSSNELHSFLSELDNQAVADDIKIALRLQLLTGLRIGEVLSIRWSDIDFKERIIAHPAIVMKSGNSAETVLSDAARRLLLEWKRKTKEGDRVFSDELNTSRFSDKMKKLQKWIAFGSHDIRRTVRTYLQELGCPGEVRLSISNHAEPVGISAHYDHSRMKAAQLHWLTKWAEKLDEVLLNSDALVSGITVADDDALLAEFKDVL